MTFFSIYCEATLYLAMFVCPSAFLSFVFINAVILVIFNLLHFHFNFHLLFLASYVWLFYKSKFYFPKLLEIKIFLLMFFNFLSIYLSLPFSINHLIFALFKKKTIKFKFLERIATL